MASIYLSVHFIAVSEECLVLKLVWAFHKRSHFRKWHWDMSLKVLSTKQENWYRSFIGEVQLGVSLYRTVYCHFGHFPKIRYYLLHIILWVQQTTIRYLRVHRPSIPVALKTSVVWRYLRTNCFSYHWNFKIYLLGNLSWNNACSGDRVQFTTSWKLIYWDAKDVK